MVPQLDLLVAQCDGGSRGGGPRFGGLALGLVAGLGEPLPYPGPERQLEVEPSGDGGGGPVRPGCQVGVAGTHHLDHQAGVKRMGGVDILAEPVGVDVGGIGRHIAADVVGRGDHREQLNVGA